MLPVLYWSGLSLVVSLHHAEHISSLFAVLMPAARR